MQTISMRAIAAGILVLSMSATAGAATLYVNASTGNDSTTRAANTAATPWQTIGRASWGSTNRSAPNTAQAAQAGDTVIVMAGTYSFSGTVGNRFMSVYNPANSGNATNPITFLAQGTVTLTAPSTRSPVIGCDGRNYIVWRGPFSLNETNIAITADTGTVVMHDATGCGVDGVFIDGNGVPNFTDNHTGVRFEYCTSCFVRNSTITDVRHTSGNHNGSAVMLYDSYNTLIDHNYIYDVDNAIYIKGVQFGNPQSGTTVRYNLMERCDECITVLASRDSRIYQNVIRDSQLAVVFAGFAASANDHPVGDWFVNNTVDNMSLTGAYPQGGLFHQNVRVWNNVFTNTYRSIYRDEGLFPTLTSMISFEHNSYFAFGAFADDTAAGTFTLATWKSIFGQDSAAPVSISIDPRFANAAADDFRLCTGAGAPHASCTAVSPARALGIDILDLDLDGSTSDVIPAGAYITNTEVIGPPSSSMPQTPVNLRITSPF